MGNKGSKGKGKKIPKGTLKDLEKKSNFNQAEIKILWEHFCSIRQDGKKAMEMDLNEFKTAVGFKGSKYVTRMFQLFDEDCDGKIQFKEFVNGLSALSDRGSFDEKLELSFLIYDADGDGKISRIELADILRACLSESDLDLAPEQIQGCVDFTFKQLQLADPNFISQEEYNAFVNSNRTEKGHDLLEMMSFNVGKRIQTLQTLYSSKSKKSKRSRKVENSTQLQTESTYFIDSY